MDTILLTDDELAELTGARRARQQIEWLDRHGWRYALSRVGKPKVAREFFLRALGASTGSEVTSASSPNWTRWSAR